MTAQSTLQSTLSSLSAFLDEERDCLLDARYDALQGINSKKSASLRQLDRYMGRTLAKGLDAAELEPEFERVRRQAHRNTQLLGAAMHGAKSAADTLNQIQMGEPVNRTYTSFGTHKPMVSSKRKNNLIL